MWEGVAQPSPPWGLLLLLEVGGWGNVGRWRITKGRAGECLGAEHLKRRRLEDSRGKEGILAGTEGRLLGLVLTLGPRPKVPACFTLGAEWGAGRHRAVTLSPCNSKQATSVSLTCVPNGSWIKSLVEGCFQQTCYLGIQGFLASGWAVNCVEAPTAPISLHALKLQGNL